MRLLHCRFLFVLLKGRSSKLDFLEDNIFCQNSHKELILRSVLLYDASNSNKSLVQVRNCSIDFPLTKYNNKTSSFRMTEVNLQYVFHFNVCMYSLDYSLNFSFCEIGGTHPSPRTQSIVLYNQFSSTLFLYASKINVIV